MSNAERRMPSAEWRCGGADGSDAGMRGHGDVRTGTGKTGCYVFWRDEEGCNIDSTQYIRLEIISDCKVYVYVNNGHGGPRYSWMLRFERLGGDVT